MFVEEVFKPVSTISTNHSTIQQFQLYNTHPQNNTGQKN